MSLTMWSVIWVSIKVSVSATVWVMLLSIFLARIFAHNRSKLIKALELLVYLPMAMPPVALGYGLLLIFGHKSWLGKILHDYFSIDIAFTFIGAVVAAVFVSLGIGVRTIRLALEQICASQIQVASLLGASKLQVFFYIIMPQCGPAIASGTILVFIRALSEFGATVVLAGNSLGETRTLALAIWVSMETPGKERECLFYVMVAIFISLIALISTEVLLRSSNK